MFIYWVVWFFLCFSTFINQYKSPLNKIFLSLFIVFLILFVGLRFQVGADWYTYLLFYERYNYIDLKDVIFGMEPGYYLLNYIGNYLGFADTVFVNFICAAILFFFLFIFSIKLKKYWLVLLICYPYFILVVSMGYTRQSVAIAIALWAFYLLSENKNIKFITFILLAFLFHKTAILLLIFLPIYYLKNEKVLSYLYCFLSMLILLFSLRYLTLNEESIYLGNSDVSVSSTGVIVRFTYHLIPLFCYIIFRKDLCNSENKRMFILLMDYTCYLIVFLLFLSFYFSTLVDRFNLYLIFFDIFSLISVSLLLNRNKQIILITVLILFYSFHMYVWFFYGNYAMKSWIPYSNYITNYLVDFVL